MTSTRTKTSRNKNHSGHTYEMPNGRFRTVIMFKGKPITAVGGTAKESNALARAKLKNLPQAFDKLSKEATKMKLIDFLPEWLHGKHQKKIAATTYRRYVSLMEIWIIHSLGHIKVIELNKHHVNSVSPGYLLQPNRKQLENDSTLQIAGLQHDGKSLVINAHQWFLWVHSMGPLSGQSPEEYEVRMSQLTTEEDMKYEQPKEILTGIELNRAVNASYFSPISPGISAH